MLKESAALADYLRSLLTGTGGELSSFDGFFVEDGGGKIWGVREAFEDEYLEKRGLNSLGNRDLKENFYPTE